MRVQTFGIMANAPWPKRVWLGPDLKPDFAELQPHVQCLALGQLMDHAERQLQGTTSGRVLVEFQG